MNKAKLKIVDNRQALSSTVPVIRFSHTNGGNEGNGVRQYLQNVKKVHRQEDHSEKNRQS